jgi:NTP pyrophosphatase (non-canonical NTP hydrolase)
MDFKQIQQRALEIREKYTQFEIQKTGTSWTKSQIMEGFVGDVGDLMKVVMAKEGAREMENVDEKLAHELSDCLWCVLVLAHQYNVNLEVEFMKTLDSLEQRISSKKG